MECPNKGVVSLIQGRETSLATAWEVPEIISDLVAQQAAPPEPTEEELLRQQAWKEAYQQGLAQGKAEGIELGRQEGAKLAQEEGRQQIDQLLQPLQPLVDALQQPLGKELDESILQSIAELVIRISSQVVKGELSVTPEHIQAVVIDLFQHLPMTEREVHLILHPQDRELLEQSNTLSSAGAQYSLETDDSLLRGDCRVESHNFSVDATVEQRLQQAVQQIFGGRQVTETESSEVDEVGEEKA